MELIVALAVFGAAVLHASWNAMVKSDGDPWVALALTNGAVAVVALPLVFLYPLPAADAWPLLLASIAVHSGYHFFLAASYQFGDLSRVYPIARGTAPPLVAIAGVLFVDETMPALGWLGVGAVAAGLLGLGHRGQDGRALTCAFVTAMFVACYTVLDGLGVRAAGQDLSYIGWLLVLDAVPYGVFVYWRRRRTFVTTVATGWRRFLAGGACAALAYGIVMWAMARAPLAYVSSIRETSVILAAVIGTVMLKESFGRRRIVASTMVAAGVTLLILHASR